MTPSASFLSILRRHAEATPDREVFSLVDGEAAVSLDFAGLWQRVGRVGSALARDIAPGDRVAICMENRPAWPVAYLSVWFAGGVTVPIDPALEPHAIQRVLEHSRARFVLTSHALGDKVAEAAAELQVPPRLLNVDADGDRRWDGVERDGGVPVPTHRAPGESWDTYVAGVPSLPAPRARPEGPATLMYTSGTTGLPKGVMLSEQALAENVVAGLERIEFTADDCVLGVLPLFHALPMMANFLAPLWIGGRVVFLRELNPDRIIAAFPAHGITVFACVPLFFYRFHDRVMKRMAALPPLKRRIAGLLLGVNRVLRGRLGIDLGRRFFPQVHAPFGDDLRVFLTGGAKFDPTVYRDFLDLGFPLVQGYGLTEGAAGLTLHPLGDIRPDTVGTPVRGIEIRIADADGSGVGEIQARTPSRMLGYYGNEEATAAVFAGEWLRTGDLGTIDPDGHLRITGRAKDVIVLASGKNIYPEELEAFYGKAAIVAEICVLGIDDPTRRGAERLHAVVVPDLDVARRRGEANVREMVKWELDGLAAQLPSPQRLSSLEIRTEPLPRTSTRKLKRFELKKEVLEGRTASSETGAPPAQVPAVTTGEPGGADAPWAADVIALVSRHAGVAMATPEQHLDLDLGLESLDRVELQAELEEAFGLDIPEEAAGEVQTVADLLAVVEGELDDDARARQGSADRWAEVLSRSPDGIEPYLRDRPLGHLVVRAIFGVVRLVQRLWGFRTSGADRLPVGQPFMVAPNHLSYVDPFVLAMALPPEVIDRIFFVGYAAYFEGWLTRRFARLFRTIPIDQNRNLERAMQAASEGLRRGMVLGIFPEGARSSDGQLKRFRRGIGILGRVHGVPVVPVGLWGTYEMWPRSGKFRPHRVAVAFGEPMDPPGSRETEEEFVEALREEVARLTDRARELYENGSD